MKTIFMARAQWNGTKVKHAPTPLLPLVISIWVAGAAATPIPTHVSCVCVSVLYMCPFDLIEVFQHNYRAFRAKSTATNQRCRGGAGKGRDGIEAIQAHNALISGTRHTVPHTHSCGHLTLRHFVAFAYAWGPCGVYATSGTWNNYRAAATGVALVLKESRGKGSAETMLGGNKNASYKMNFYAAFSQCLQRCAHK